MEEKIPTKATSRDYYMFAFRILGDFGASLAVPVVIMVLIGQYLDSKYDKGPLFTIIGFAIAAFISAKIIYKKSSLYGAQYKKMNDSTKNNEPSK